jgi:hypothetical protein
LRHGCQRDFKSCAVRCTTLEIREVFQNNFISRWMCICLYDRRDPPLCGVYTCRQKVGSPCIDRQLIIQVTQSAKRAPTSQDGAIRALQGCCEPHAPPSWTHCSDNLCLNPSLSQCATRIVLILACQPSRRDPVPQSPNGLFSFLQSPFAEAFSPYDHIDIEEHAISSCFSQSHISFYRCNSTRARRSRFAGL